MPLEDLVEKVSNRLSIPPRRVVKIGVERKIAFIKGLRLHLERSRGVKGQVKEGQIEIIDFLVMFGRKGQGFFCVFLPFPRGSKEEIDVGGNSDLLQILQGEGGLS